MSSDISSGIDFEAVGPKLARVQRCS